jgi:hypothetical protein
MQNRSVDFKCSEEKPYTESSLTNIPGRSLIRLDLTQERSPLMVTCRRKKLLRHQAAAECRLRNTERARQQHLGVSFLGMHLHLVQLVGVLQQQLQPAPANHHQLQTSQEPSAHAGEHREQQSFKSVITRKGGKITRTLD